MILFDGVCNLCNGAVQWIIRHQVALIVPIFCLEFFSMHQQSIGYAIGRKRGTVLRRTHATTAAGARGRSRRPWPASRRRLGSRP